jgi:hypothetical protein
MLAGMLGEMKKSTAIACLKAKASRCPACRPLMTGDPPRATLQTGRARQLHCRGTIEDSGT